MRNRTKHLWALALCALFCCALLASCTGAPAQPGPQETGPAVQAGSEYAQTFASGGSPLENANCRALSAAPEGEGCTVTLEFASGSRAQRFRRKRGKPRAHVHSCTNRRADRVVLTLYGLSFWDYDHSADLSAGEDCFIRPSACLARRTTASTSCFSSRAVRRSPPGRRAEGLKLTFVPQEHEQGENYFVVVDGTALFTDGTLSMENGFFPTLCSDGETLATISQPLAGEEEAQQLLNALWESIGTSAVSVVSLAPGELPVAPGDAPRPTDLRTAHGGFQRPACRAGSGHGRRRVPVRRPQQQRYGICPHRAGRERQQFAGAVGGRRDRFGAGGSSMPTSTR